MIPSEQNLAAYNDIQTNLPKYKKSFNRHFGNITALAFSSDGKFMIVGNSNVKRTIMIINVATKKIVHDLPSRGFWVYAIEVSPDGKTFLTLVGDNSSAIIDLRDFKTGKLLQSFPGHKNHAITYSSDSKTMVTGDKDNSIQLWNLKTGKPIRSFLGHTASILSFTFSTDDKTLISGSADKSIRLWNLETGKHIQTFLEHTSGVSSISLSPDGKTIVSASNTEVYYWNVEQGFVVNTLLLDFKEVNAISLSPNRDYVLIGLEDKTARVLNLETKEEIVLKGHKASIDAITFSRDGHYILTGSYDKTVKLWNFKQLKSKDDALIRHSDGIRAAIFSPDDAYIFAGGHPRVATLWNAKTLQKILSFNEHGDTVTSVAFSKNGQYIATGSWDKKVILRERVRPKQIKLPVHKDSINAVKFRKIKELQHKDWINSVAFSSDGEYILVSDKGAVTLWDLKTATPVRTFFGRNFQAVFAPNKQQILIADYYNVLKLYDAKKGGLLHTFKGHKDRVSCATFSKDGTKMLSGSFDNTAILWNMETKAIIHTFIGHGVTVSSVAFSPDNKLVLTGSADQTAILWNIQTGKAIRSFQHQRTVVSVQFTSDGKRMLTGSLDSTVKLWSNHITEWDSSTYKLSEEEQEQYGIEIDY